MDQDADIECDSFRRHVFYDVWTFERLRIFYDCGQKKEVHHRRLDSVLYPSFYKVCISDIINYRTVAEYLTKRKFDFQVISTIHDNDGNHWYHSI